MSTTTTITIEPGKLERTTLGPFPLSEPKPHVRIRRGEVNPPDSLVIQYTDIEVDELHYKLVYVMQNFGNRAVKVFLHF